LTDSNRQHRIRQEQTLEAQVLENDTLVSIALRFSTTVAEIKRLNKIERDNEIFAYKVLKVPLTAHNILLDTLPKVHKSGNSSPQANGKFTASTSSPNKEKLEEKLLLASVSNATIAKLPDAVDRLEEANTSEENSVNDPLLRQFRGYPRSIRPPNDFIQFNGSDCELNWIVLLLAILALCVIVPLIYVFLIYEHPEKFHATHSKYDDPDLKFHFHVNSTPDKIKL
jgi:LysM repeat protein